MEGCQQYEELDCSPSIRVLFVAPSLEAGGAERILTQIASSLSGKFTVGVLTFATSDSDHYQLSAAVERISLDCVRESQSVWHAVRNNWARLRKVRVAVNDFQPNVVISFIDQVNIVTLTALIGMQVPVIINERTEPRHHPIGKVWHVARRLLYPRAYRLVVQTSSVAAWAQSFLRSEQILVIPNFVRDLPTENIASRELKLVLAVGRLGPEKGFDVLLRAMHGSRLTEKGVKLVILGEGPQRQSLQELAKDLEIEESVTMPGLVGDPETWMAHATVFVMSSTYEGFPNALLEAMAMGCPVISTDCDSGPRHIIQDHQNGLLIPVGDSAAIAEALVRLFNDQDLRDSLGRQARLVRDKFSKQVILKKWESLIRSVSVQQM